MKLLTKKMVLRHCHGGLLSFSNDHAEDAASTFPRDWWSELEDSVAQALWCSIAGREERGLPPDHGSLVKHARNAFLKFEKEHPFEAKAKFPRKWWGSIMKRMIRTLWTELLREEMILPGKLHAGEVCDSCKMARIGKTKVS